ncbi:MAG TPA: hypothetical protein VJZ76_25355 [Thermoanaerobaculia bacterium]|nr:hypothetical protein [Thermoanaerobaculia bacterium]
MKKTLIVIAIIAVGAWVVVSIVGWAISRFWGRAPLAASTAKPWPGGLGSLDAVAARFPPLQSNAAAEKLTSLAAALPKSTAVDDYVGREIARGALTIDAPPPLPDVAAMRELLLREPVVWSRPGGVGDIGGQESTDRRGMVMTVSRALVASALAKARAGDAAAWEDLHAVWNLSRSLDAQPQVMMQTAELSMARMVNAVAWKLPLPAPPWLAALQQRDAVQPLLAAFQYQAASYQTTPMPTVLVVKSVEHDRGIAEALAKNTKCDVSTTMNDLGVDLSSVWRRGFRYRAEREATANALRVREGKPIETRSQCSDGAWRFDGTTLRFSRAIATEKPDTPMPLVLRVKP